MTLPADFTIVPFEVIGSGVERPPTTRLGQRLRQLRKDLGISQTEMAGLLGLAKTTANAGRVCGWERGKNMPTLPTLHRYGQAFGGMTVSQLLDGII
ncbi:helix-turn-helix domain-containing protein [Mycobacterium sp. TY814]|uniref:helix-turn-helix domain-containing protein n=1 Tax=unclassified Mycobacterium TaxID=2642494 RepID=UPI00274038D7|nr:helix-turn-helix transcriptional regulator [Mycobacterium sp. TY814]MDP7724771.1 helix-turn-helix transcriptional regulator [Mycobacterium sp. TY814]